VGYLKEGFIPLFGVLEFLPDLQNSLLDVFP